MKQQNYERPTQIHLELPDYRYDYEQWVKKKEQEELENKKETVIIEVILDLF